MPAPVQDLDLSSSGAAFQAGQDELVDEPPFSGGDLSAHRPHLPSSFPPPAKERFSSAQTRFCSELQGAAQPLMSSGASTVTVRTYEAILKAMVPPSVEKLG